jgi:hypothetical protein
MNPHASPSATSTSSSVSREGAIPRLSPQEMLGGKKPKRRGLSVDRVFTTPGSDPLEEVTYEKRVSRIKNTDGSIVFEMEGAEIPAAWSQVATDIVVSKYFRKAGVPQYDAQGSAITDAKGNVVTGPERQAGGAPPRRVLAPLGRDARVLRDGPGRAGL